VSVLRALAIAFAAIAVLCLLAAVLGMINGRMSPRTGTLLRTLALFCFVLTVVLNVVSRS
jgi:hypothetical protein